LIKRQNKNSVVVEELIDMVIKKGGLDYAAQKMNEFKTRAVEGLMQFQECEARDSLIRLMDYITTRNK
jgi:octaprenyl-diphosphate synthase